MGYVVIKFFTDLRDNNHAYHEGDTFPREGITVSANRIAELSTSNNRRGVPLIRKQGDATEGTSEVKEEPQDTSAGVSAPKKPKPRKRQRKTQEDI